MLDKQAYILFSAHLKSCEELHDGLIALEVFCENIKRALVAAIEDVVQPLEKEEEQVDEQRT